jgi:exosortase/archaeosortase family protein
VVILAGPQFGLTSVWAARLDLLTLPVFVLGLVLVTFGADVARAQRAALLFLVLAWPLPYAEVLFHILGPFSDATVASVKWLLHVVHVASPTHAPGGATFLTHGRHATTIDVAATCSGISSFFGFLLLGGASCALLAGSALRRALWVCTGLALSWCFNLVRIIAILGAAAQWGRHIALGVIHPYAGILLFTATTVLMATATRFYGLRWRDLSVASDRDPPQRAGGRRRPALPLGVVLVLVLATAAGWIADGRLRRYDPTSFANLRSVASSAAPALDGYTLAQLPDVTWGKPYFGDSSTWSRYRAVDDADHGPNFTLETITTPDLDALSSYGVDAYFRGFRVRSVQPELLAPGVRGELVSPFGRPPVVVWVRRVPQGGGRAYQEVFLAGAGGAAQGAGAVIAAARSAAAAGLVAVPEALK